MCEVCAVFGISEHWVEAGGLRNVAYPGEDIRDHREVRRFRIRLVNALLQPYGLQCGDWDGDAYVVRSNKGQEVVAENLSKIWTVAERLTGKVCDPLDLDHAFQHSI